MGKNVGQIANLPQAGESPSQPAIFYLILALALLRGVLYASVVPPWQAPDEPAQFERARAALSGEWSSTAEQAPAWYDELKDSLFAFQFWNYIIPRVNPVPEEPLGRYIALYHEVYGGLYSSRPAYIVMGWPLFLARQQAVIFQLYLVRLNMALMGVGIICLAYIISRTLFPDDPFMALGAPALILFNPQHTHLLAAVNNGNLAELLVTIVFYFMVRSIIQGFSVLNTLAILSFSLLAMWTKATAYFLVFVLGAMGLFYLWGYRRRWRWLLPISPILVGLLYFFAPERLKLLAVTAWLQVREGNFHLEPALLPTLFNSFWAAPGWLLLWLHPFWYQAILLLCILALAGYMVWFATRRPALFSVPLQPRIRALLILSVAVVAALGVLLGWHVLTGVMDYRQGRSIYPVIVPISILLTLGWRQLMPASWRNVGLLAAITLFFLFDSLVLFGYMIPFFYSQH